MHSCARATKEKSLVGCWRGGWHRLHRDHVPQASRDKPRLEEGIRRSTPTLLAPRASPNESQRRKRCGTDPEKAAVVRDSLIQGPPRCDREKARDRLPPRWLDYAQTKPNAA